MENFPIAFDLSGAREAEHADTDIAKELARIAGERGVDFDADGFRENRRENGFTEADIDSEIIKFLTTGSGFKKEESPFNKGLATGLSDAAALIPGALAETAGLGVNLLAEGTRAATSLAIKAIPSLEPALGPLRESSAGVARKTTIGQNFANVREAITGTLADKGIALRSKGELPPSQRPAFEAGAVIGGGVPFLAAPFAIPATVGGRLGTIVTAARSAPKSFLLGESTALATSAVAGAAAEAVAPDSPLAVISAEILGGLAPGALLLRGGTGTIKAAKTLVLSQTKAGRLKAAENALINAIVKNGEDPAQIAAALERNIGGASIPTLPGTVAQISNSPVLMAAERQLAAHNAKFGSVARQATVDTFVLLRKMAERLSLGGNPDSLVKAANLRKIYFDELIGGILKKADDKLTEARALVGTGGQAARVQASVNASEIMKAAIKEGVNIKRSLWGAVDKNVQVGTANAFARVAQNESKAVARAVNDALPLSVDGKIRRMKTSGQLIRFRSELLSKARGLSRGLSPDLNTARELNEIAATVLDDLTAAPGGIKGLSEAREFTKRFAETIDETFAGRTQRSTSSGSNVIEPELLLDTAFGSGKAISDVRFRQLRQGAGFPDAALAETLGVQRGVFGPAMFNEQERFLRAAAAETLDGDKLNPAKLQKFMNDNSVVLQRFPALRARLANADAAQASLVQARESTGSASNIIQKEAAFSKLTGIEDLGGVMDKISRSNAPTKEFNQLARFARGRGPAAVAGLRTGTLKWLLNKSTRADGTIDFGKFDQLFFKKNGGQISLARVMIKNRTIDPATVGRYLRLVSADRRLRGLLAQGRVIDDIVGKEDLLVDYLIRIQSARASSVIAGPVGGAQLVVASATSKAARTALEKIPASRTVDAMIELLSDSQAFANMVRKSKSASARAATDKNIGEFLKRVGIISVGKPTTAQALFVAPTRQENK